MHTRVRECVTHVWQNHNYAYRNTTRAEMHTHIYVWSRVFTFKHMRIYMPVTCMFVDRVTCTYIRVNAHMKVHVSVGDNVCAYVHADMGVDAGDLHVCTPRS